MNDIIYSYLEKGKDGLGRDIRYIKEEQLPSLIDCLKNQFSIPVVSNSVICPNCGCNKIDKHHDWYTCLNRECDFGGKL